MKDILFEGHRMLTTDAVADAVLAYARVLHATEGTDVIEFPVVLDGELSRCSLLLSSTVGIAVVDAAVVLSPSLPGADSACAEIERRTSVLS